ncbi:MAG: MarR family transcriptional regulator [Rhizobiales bacterium]|nr:MarR family transcriptional regulator [Hyphomicrobiales bacterium]
MERASGNQGEAVLIELRRIIRAMDIHSKKAGRYAGLTTPQLVVLQACARLGDVTLRRLSDEASLSQGTVTAIMDRLEAKNLAERYRSLTDRRIIHARLTAEGRAALETSPPLMEQKFTERFSQLPPARQAEMIAVLKEIAAMMNAGSANALPPFFTSSGFLEGEQDPA